MTEAISGGESVSVVITTAIALAAGAISGWVAAAFKRRERREERIRVEVLRWTNPILGAIDSLQARLGNILDDCLYRALDPETRETRPVDDDWAIGFEYAMESTLFLFAEYFAWIRLLQERLSFELFESQEARDRFFAAVWEVSEALSLWPDPNIDAEGADVQVFVLQQRAIGELVIRREADAPRVVGYAEFLALRDTDPRFGRVLAPLSSLLEGVEPDTKRWQRLARTREALAGLRVRCDQLLAPPRAA